MSFEFVLPNKSLFLESGKIETVRGKDCSSALRVAAGRGLASH